MTIDGIPCRCQMNLWTPAKTAIWQAIQAVESVGAHPFLTEAVILLGQAKDKVSDYIEQDENLVKASE
ncbi:MAG TPA: hypothetical protein V6C63_21210 [Allocoleopsis sp.]